MQSNSIITDVLDNFKELSKHPRPSGKESEASKFLCEWAKKNNLDFSSDSVNNVYISAPATKGLEKIPQTILQAHMDMVCLSDDSDFDFLKNEIELIENGNELTANKTTLGADDGIGVAIIMTILKGVIPHGPIKAIFTVCEETSMLGVHSISKNEIKNAKYLINIDSECSKEVVVSSASGDILSFTTKNDLKTSLLNYPVLLEISGLKGGHSGMDIIYNRLNAIKGISSLLSIINENNINFDLVSIKGGIANNAIPNYANSVILIEEKSFSKLEKIVASFNEILKVKYKDIESNITLKAFPIKNDNQQAFSDDIKNKVLYFINNVFDGVYSINTKINLVEASSNMGIVDISINDPIKINCFFRSSIESKRKEINNQIVNIGKQCSFSYTEDHVGDPWEFNENSKLLSIVKSSYEEINNEPIEVKPIHAGLECGTFLQINPNLDIISIGPDLIDVHTTKEKLFIDSIDKTCELLSLVLERI